MDDRAELLIGTPVELRRRAAHFRRLADTTTTAPLNGRLLALSADLEREARRPRAGRRSPRRRMGMGFAASVAGR